VDDHAEFLALAAQLVEPEFDVLRICESGQALLAEMASLDPDLLVLDISMPSLSGIETAQLIRSRGFRAKIVFLTVHQDEDYLKSALATGALGYVTKDRLASDLVPAMHSALAGERFVSQPLAVSK
jgi:DNA-binding NarL/FixJ family response regulator